MGWFTDLRTVSVWLKMMAESPFANDMVCLLQGRPGECSESPSS